MSDKNKNNRISIFFSFILFTIIIFTNINIIISLDNDNRFTESEIQLTFKVANDRDSAVIRSNILGEIRNISVDITSDQHILYLSKEMWKEQNFTSLKKTSIITQDGQSLNVFLKKVNIGVGGGTTFRKSYLIENLPTFLSLTKDKKKFHSIGLAHEIDDQKSIINRLYNQKLITKKQFSVLYSYPDWGSLSFGEEGKIVSAMPKLMQKCKAVKSKYWGCHLNGIFFGDFNKTTNDEAFVDINKVEKIKIDKETIFDYGIKFIIVPEEVLNFFIEKYFKEFLYEGKCKIYQDYFLTKISCNEEVVSKTKRIHFVFDDVIDVHLFGKYLFDKENNFLIISEKGNSNFIFGKTFLSRYNMIYSYDEDMITFFGMFGKDKLNQPLFSSKKEEKKIINEKEKKIENVNVDVSVTNDYIRKEIPKINKNISWLLKGTIALLGIGILVIILAFIKIKRKKPFKKKVMNKTYK